MDESERTLMSIVHAAQKRLWVRQSPVRLIYAITRTDEIEKVNEIIPSAAASSRSTTDSSSSAPRSRECAGDDSSGKKIGSISPLETIFFSSNEDANSAHILGTISHGPRDVNTFKGCCRENCFLLPFV